MELRTIGDHVRKRRLDLGLLQREVALRIGVDKTTIHNWEAGRTHPNVRALRGAIRFLGHNPTENGSTLSERLPSAWLR
jgi:transcriptional regulator with XRE-family HTH domain